VELDKVISELENIKMQFGGKTEVQLQDDGTTGQIRGFGSFFIIPEEYKENEKIETIINIRWWPY